MKMSDIRKLILEDPSLLESFRNARDDGFDGDLENFLEFQYDKYMENRELNAMGGRISFQDGGTEREAELLKFYLDEGLDLEDAQDMVKSVLAVKH